MSQDYLLKTEPSEYSFANLLRDAATEWEGVSNPAAVKNLRENHSRKFIAPTCHPYSDILFNFNFWKNFAFAATDSIWFRWLQTAARPKNGRPLVSSVLE